MLTHGLPSAAQAFPAASSRDTVPADGAVSHELPDDPGQELLPIAEPEPVPAAGLPVDWDADDQTLVGDALTLTGHVIFHYRGYTLRADKVVYHRATTELEAEGNLEVSGGPADVLIHATHGDMRLNMHTARFYNAHGSQGLRSSLSRNAYSTNQPFLFTARVLLETGEGRFQMIDGSMTNCQLPHPDWQVIAHTIKLEDGVASTSNSFFELLGMPIFYLPYLRHPSDENGRESGWLLPVISNSSIKGFIVGTQYYWAINRSMDMVIGTEYFSRRGWAPNGDFRYKGHGLNSALVRWNSLLDRGVVQQVSTTSTSASGATVTTTASKHVDQGGVDIVAEGRRDFSPFTHAAGSVDYLSSYTYRLIFNDNFSQAISSQVASKVGLTHVHNGLVPSAVIDRFETFASSTEGDEARILHLPSLRFDAVTEPLGTTPLYGELGSSLSFMNRSEPHFHARNVIRSDIYPRLMLPLHAGGWDLVPAVALRDTSYSISQKPDLSDLRLGVPTISHSPLNRVDAEASLDLRAPVLTRDFVLPGLNRMVRHVIEPEFTYRYVGGIGNQGRRVLLIDTSDIATDTNEIGYSITQRFYARPLHERACAEGESCPPQSRQWASWQIAQKFFLDPYFGGALISGRRNVFDSTLDLTGVAFLTGPNNRAPVLSRMRFEMIDNLRVEWDLDYDPVQGQMSSDNLFAGYSFGEATIGIGHALLNAVDESSGSASTIKSQQLTPFLTIGKQSKAGFSLASNVSYDFVHGQLQHGGVQASYNWDCCGLTVGYRRFQLGSIRDETQYLYSFTIANFGSVGDIRRSNSNYRDPALPPAY
jgi:LPS-assembly protein